MKAILCEKFGGPSQLQLREMPVPQAKEGEVVITVKACSVNFPDGLIIQNLYQFKPELPFSPGGEVSGLVKEVGEGVKHLKVGDRVLALCGWGGMAEELVVEANKVFPMLPEMDFITAASVMYNYGTSYHALKDRAKLQKGETLLVLGAAGGVGIAAVELGKKMGATVIAAASTEEKLVLCREKGATHVINYTEDNLKDRVKELTNGKGVDVVYDPVGDKYAEPAIRSLAWKGRYLVVGFAGGEIPKIPLNLALLKGSSLVGVFWGRFAQTEPMKSMQNLKDLGEMFISDEIAPHIHKLYPLENGAQAIQDLMDRKVIGKAVVLCTTEEEASKRPNVKTKEIVKSTKLVFGSPQEFKDYQGKSLGTTDWLMVSQEMVNKFADATLDHQWIHIDVERAKDSDFGGTIAHGFLSLSLTSHLLSSLYDLKFSSVGINYGTDKVRFLAPILVGSEIQLSAKLKLVSEVKNGGLKMISEVEIYQKNQERTAMYAELIGIVY
ncbi:NADPH:quinone reductase [Spirosomataceae bacterium TFI 002]|nr:NADPH:quinone reductase [Spirosomataceae bacterium TFI 002]